MNPMVSGRLNGKQMTTCDSPMEAEPTLSGAASELASVIQIAHNWAERIEDTLFGAGPKPDCGKDCPPGPLGVASGIATSLAGVAHLNNRLAEIARRVGA